MDANSLCEILKTHPIFKECENVVDVAPFFEACKYDICSDANSNQRDLYRCRAVAAYAHECSSRGVVIDWFNNDDFRDIKISCYNSKYGKCYGGASYSECTKLVNATCKDFSRSSLKYQGKTDYCVAGCSCPEGQALDKVNDQYLCVTKESCTCYDFATNKYYQPDESMKKACSTW